MTGGTSLSWGRTWPAIVTFGLPVVFSLVVMQGIVDFMLPKPGQWLRFSADNMTFAVYDRFARDIEARLLYGIISAFGLLAALAATALAGFVLVRQLGWRNGLRFLACAAAFGVGVCILASTAQDTLRGNVLDVLIKEAERVGAIVPGALAKLHCMIYLNMAIGLGGTAALLAGFAAVAVRAAPEDFQDQDDGARRLRERIRFLTYLTLAGSAILVLMVAVNKVLLTWPQGVLLPDAAKSYGVMSNAVANYWGAIGTAVLLCALVPAVVSVRADVEKASGARRFDFPAQEKWRKENGLEIAPSSALVTVVTAAAPLLTGPAIDIVAGFVRG